MSPSSLPSKPQEIRFNRVEWQNAKENEQGKEEEK